jgi:XTP/dITP diphosphohydrolase
MNKELYYVTSNDGKFAEVARFLKMVAPDIELKQFATDIEEIQTMDQQAVAVDKAKKAFKVLQKPLLVDDAAIYFERYNKFPGTLSRYVYTGLGFEGIKKLFEEYDPAYFLLYVVYVDQTGQEHIFEGACFGRLTKPATFEGNLNLPFDVFFIPDGAEITYAAMAKDFDRYAHFFYRMRALQKFMAWYGK